MRPGGENPRPDDLAFCDPLLLRHDPFDGFAADGQRRGNAVIQVELGLPFLVMHVGIDETGKRGQTVGLDDAGALGNSDAGNRTHRLDALAFDHDRRVLERRAAAAVDQKPDFEHQDLGSCRLRVGQRIWQRAETEKTQISPKVFHNRKRG